MKAPARNRAQRRRQAREVHTVAAAVAQQQLAVLAALHTRLVLELLRLLRGALALAGHLAACVNPLVTARNV